VQSSCGSYLLAPDRGLFCAWILSHLSWSFGKKKDKKRQTTECKGCRFPTPWFAPDRDFLAW
jgi:hypothetical protein